MVARLPAVNTLCSILHAAVAADWSDWGLFIVLESWHRHQSELSWVRVMEGEQRHVKPGYSSVHDHYANKMMRYSLSVGVVWAMASICLTILLVVVFLQDQWIGDTPQSEGPGNFGLWRWCSDK